MHQAFKFCAIPITFKQTMLFINYIKHMKNELIYPLLLTADSRAEYSVPGRGNVFGIDSEFLNRWSCRPLCFKCEYTFHPFPLMNRPIMSSPPT